MKAKPGPVGHVEHMDERYGILVRSCLPSFEATKRRLKVNTPLYDRAAVRRAVAASSEWWRRQLEETESRLEARVRADERAKCARMFEEQRIRMDELRTLLAQMVEARVSAMSASTPPALVPQVDQTAALHYTTQEGA